MTTIFPNTTYWFKSTTVDIDNSSCGAWTGVPGGAGALPDAADVNVVPGATPYGSGSTPARHARPSRARCTPGNTSRRAVRQPIDFPLCPIQRKEPPYGDRSLSSRKDEAYY